MTVCKRNRQGDKVKPRRRSNRIIRDEYDDGRRQLLRSILGGGAVIQKADGVLVPRPIGPDRNILIDAFKKFNRNEINNKKFKEALFHWVTDEEYNDIDNMFPTEDEMKQEKEDVAYNKDLDERVENHEEEEEDLWASQRKLYSKLCSNRRLCSFAGGCTNLAVKGGVCIKHGAQVTYTRCSKEGCTKFPQGGTGVCIAHGAKVKRCSKGGCTNRAVKGGVCIKHGAKVKRCSSQGCQNQAQKGGVCIKHGAKVKRCSSQGCQNQAQKGGVCKRHGAQFEPRKRCSSQGCQNQAQTGGVCIRHGAQVKPRKRCSSQGCNNIVVKGGVCKKHGAQVKRCSRKGCPNQVYKGGVCRRHGEQVK